MLTSVGVGEGGLEGTLCMESARNSRVRAFEYPRLVTIMWSSGVGSSKPDVDAGTFLDPAIDPKLDVPSKATVTGMKVALFETEKGRDIVPAVAQTGDYHVAMPDRARVPATLAAKSHAWPRISVIIPARNEALNLPHVLAQLPKDLHEVILVDGHSTDDTVEVAQRHWPGIRVVQDTRRGKGNALACGFAAARGDIIVMIDADGSADGAEIPRFVRALLDGADIAKGSRFLQGGGSSDITHVRRAGNWVLTNIVNMLYRTTYTDLCYGYNAFWTRHLPVLHVDCDGFEVETLINIRIAKAGLRVTEVPSFEASRLSGASNLHALRDGFRVLKTIVRERQTGGTQRREALAEGQATVDVGA